LSSNLGLQIRRGVLPSKVLVGFLLCYMSPPSVAFIAMTLSMQGEEYKLWSLS